MASTLQVTADTLQVTAARFWFYLRLGGQQDEGTANTYCNRATTIRVTAFTFCLIWINADTSQERAAKSLVTATTFLVIWVLWPNLLEVMAAATQITAATKWAPVINWLPDLKS
jgi:hypothetical protein